MTANKATLDDREARQWIAKLAKNAEILENPKWLSVASAIAFRDTIEHFDREEGPDEPWQAWSKVYAERMEKIGKGGNRILQDTGRLRQAFKPTNVEVSKGRGVAWFNDAKVSGGFPYAYAHNVGGRKLPRRQFLWWSERALDTLAKATSDMMVEDK